MNLATAQIIGLIGAGVGLFTGIAPLWLDPHTVATVGGALVTFLGVVGTIIGTPNAQAKVAVQTLDDPTVMRTLVSAVSELPGINPIQTNSKAGAALMSLAADTDVPKVLPPKS